MNILVTGASGLIGAALVGELVAAGHTVKRLVRAAPRVEQGEYLWDPLHGSIPAPALENLDAVIHLAGENIADGRWTPEKKRLLVESRIQGTQLLSDTLLQLVHPPKIFLSASAIGYYGDRGERVMREDSAPGKGFLPDLCKAWEAAAQPAAQRGIRVSCLRFGIVLSDKGGALAKMLTPFRMRLGGVVGSGKQYASWIDLEDTVDAILHVLNTDSLSGPVNIVAPRPVTNQEFTRILGQALKRPTPFPMPSFAARLAFGEMADALLLASTRVEPARLQASGYPFRYPDLAASLNHILGAGQQAA